MCSSDLTSSKAKFAAEGAIKDHGSGIRLGLILGLEVLVTNDWGQTNWVNLMSEDNG